MQFFIGIPNSYQLEALSNPLRLFDNYRPKISMISSSDKPLNEPSPG